MKRSKRKQAYDAYIKSDAWAAKRAEKIKEVGSARCERCDSDKRIEIHHLTYENLGNEKLEDLEVLCNRCHAKIHRKRPRSRWKEPRLSKSAKKRIRKKYSKRKVGRPCNKKGYRPGMSIQEF